MSTLPPSIAALQSPLHAMLAGLPQPPLPTHSTEVCWALVDLTLGRPRSSAADALGQTLTLPNLLSARIVDSAAQSRPIYPLFVLVTALRLQVTVPHADWSALLHPPLMAIAARQASGHAVIDLWHAWALALGGEVLGEPAWRQASEDLWQAVFARQHPAGHLNPLTADTNLDSFVYDELTALHAAGAMAAYQANQAKLAQVHAVARYHQENTQPDNTTNQPWALATFARFDDTRAFAQQQFHDTQTWLSNRTAPAPGLVAALLADALLTLGEKA